MYLMSNTPGNKKKLREHQRRVGYPQKNPVNACYSEMICDQTVLGMNYLDCSRQTLSRIDFKIKDHAGYIVNLHGNHISFSIIFVKVMDE